MIVKGAGELQVGALYEIGTEFNSCVLTTFYVGCNTEEFYKPITIYKFIVLVVKEGCGSWRPNNEIDFSSDGADGLFFRAGEMIIKYANQ